MSNTASSVPASVLDRIGRSGGLARISDAQLAEWGVVRLHDPVAKVQRVMAAEEFEALRRRCYGVLRRYEGYLFAHHLFALKRVVAKYAAIAPEELDAAADHASALQAAGVPPIFREGLYGRAFFSYWFPDAGGRGVTEVRHASLFPNVDFILQFGAATYARHSAHAAIVATREVRPSKIPMEPATAEDVRLFRERAFTPDGKIDPLLEADILGYITDHHDVPDPQRRTEVLEESRNVLRAFELDLWDPAVPRRPFDAWDGDPSVVREWTWYLRFSPDDRIRIVEAFFERLPGPPTGDDKIQFQRLAWIFPGLCRLAMPTLHERATAREEADLRIRIEACFAEGRLRNLPEVIFEANGPWRDAYFHRAVEAITEACRTFMAKDPLGLLMGPAEFPKEAPLPYRMFSKASLKPLLDEMRLASAKLLTDEQFFAQFGDGKGRGRIGLIGHAKFRQTSPENDRLVAYLYERRTALGGRLALGPIWGLFFNE